MCWFVLTHLVAFLVDLLSARRRPDHDKDLQILLLQHQVRLLQRQRPQSRLARWEKLTLAILTSKLARVTPARGRDWTTASCSASRRPS